MKFEPGTQVVCIEDKFWIGRNRPHLLGSNGPRNNEVFTIEEVILFTDGVTLYLGLVEFPDYAFNSKYFAPIISDKELYEEINEILTPLAV